LLDEARELIRGGPATHRRARGAPSRVVRHFEPEAAYHARLRLVRRGDPHARDKAPPTWRRKQTIATGERFTCDELDALADKLAHAEERLGGARGRALRGLVRDLAVARERLRIVAGRLAEWDVASALAEVAHRDDWVRPEIDDSLELVLEDARHPVVEKLAAAGLASSRTT
jgi:DNA mismatch repair ATPase MutS